MVYISHLQVLVGLSALVVLGGCFLRHHGPELVGLQAEDRSDRRREVRFKISFKGAHGRLKSSTTAVHRPSLSSTRLEHGASHRRVACEVSGQG